MSHFAILQWNSHGYDVAKVFGSKMTSLSPVWLQLRRRGPETFDVTGLHDHDPGRWYTSVSQTGSTTLVFIAHPCHHRMTHAFQVKWCFCLTRVGQSCTQVQQKSQVGWVDTSRSRSMAQWKWSDCLNAPSPPALSVPRLLFDGWSYQDYMMVLGSEDEIEELGNELVDVAKVTQRCVQLHLSYDSFLWRRCSLSNAAAALQTEGFDGFTLELWSQLGGNKRKWVLLDQYLTLDMFDLVRK